MTQETRRPLHRLTPLHDDPAGAWLSAPQRLRVEMTGWFVWTMYVMLLIFSFFGAIIYMQHTVIFGSLRMAFIGTVMIAITLFWPTRRLALRRKSAKINQLVRGSTQSLGIAVDDFNDLEQQPEGAAVSLVGWIRGGAPLSQRVGGEPCIGLALACHQKYPGVLETLSDFELVDEAGHTIAVQVAGGRLLGASNVNLTDANERMMVVASLDLPVGAVATGWDAFVVRDGDPVMVIGFKQTAVDPTQASVRAAPARARVGSLAPKPLLIFPIAAERRAQVSAMFNLS